MSSLKSFWFIMHALLPLSQQIDPDFRIGLENLSISDREGEKCYILFYLQTKESLFLFLNGQMLKDIQEH